MTTARRPVLPSLVAAAFALPAAAQAANTNQCTCPRVAADGFGSSACSANESANRCRVEFNQFPDDVIDRARAVLEKAGARLGATAPRGDAQDVTEGLAKLPEAERVDVIAIYLAVAASRDPDYGSDSAKSLHAAVHRDAETSRRIAEAFDARAVAASEGRPPTIRGRGNTYATPRGDGVVTSPGCVAIRVGPQWYMYKAAWSPARSLPRCAEE